MTGKSARTGEFDLIARFFAPLTAAEPGAFGLTDDAAVIDLEPGEQMVVTTDTLVAGVHFRMEDGARSIAAKLLRVNLSDLAAMGARPVAYTLSAALPGASGQAPDEAWFEEFSQALAQDQAFFGVTLVGGDTVATPGPLSLTLTALGKAADGRVLRRSGALPGDTVYVSGTIGDGALGLLVLNGGLAELPVGMRDALRQRYLRPTPRVELGRRLLDIAHSAIDVSDGLAADLGHVCRTSAVAATIDADRIPLSPAARAAVEGDTALFSLVLAGGDDYELLFTAAADSGPEMAGLSRELGIPITAIGLISQEQAAADRVRLVDAEGRNIAVGDGGYRHF